MPKAKKYPTTTPFRPMGHDRMMQIIDLEKFTDLGVDVGDAIGLLGMNKRELREIVANGVWINEVSKTRAALAAMLDLVELSERRCREASQAA
jgi:hypothetical protein